MDQKRILCTGGSGFIGTHYIDLLSQTKHQYLNIDINNPKKIEHNSSWVECDILDYPKLQKVFFDFQPTHIVHLAATANTFGKSLECYKTNTTGTLNVLNVANETPSVQHVLITSTQHVRKPGSPPQKNDTDYIPYGYYGESKVITERLTRESNLRSSWTIIRPTTIWGPYHPYLVNGLWRVMKLGLYIHPARDPVIRSTGYVKNTVWQILNLQNIDLQIIDKKVYYVGEEPMRQLDWVNALSLGITEHPVKQMPKYLLRMLAYLGDFLGLAGVNFPMNSPRFNNLTTTNPVPLKPIYDLIGPPPYSVEEGVDETVRWLRSQSDFWN